MSTGFLRSRFRSSVIKSSNSPPMLLKLKKGLYSQAKGPVVLNLDNNILKVRLKFKVFGLQGVGCGIHPSGLKCAVIIKTKMLMPHDGRWLSKILYH